MEIVINHQVSDELKAAMSKAGKTAARFILKEYGSCGAVFSIEMSDPREGDTAAESNGIVFVVESKFAFALRYPEIEKVGDLFGVKKTSCGCL